MDVLAQRRFDSGTGKSSHFPPLFCVRFEQREKVSRRATLQKKLFCVKGNLLTT